MMERKKYEVLLASIEPMAHHGETLGNHALLMREKVRAPSGRFVDVPILTGDAIRHGLREAAAYATLDAAGMLDQEGGPQLTEAALRLLFNGGVMEGGDGGADIKGYRMMVDIFPPLALFGGCAGNRVIGGRLMVGRALLVCTESMHLLPPWVAEHVASEGASVRPAREHVANVQRVRMDPSLRPDKRLLLSDDERGRIEGRLLDHEAASSSGDIKAIEELKSAMMPRTFETVAAGSLWWWQVSATCYSDLDVDCFHVALGSWLHAPRVGSRSGTGFGGLAPVVGRDVAWTRPSDAATSFSGADIQGRKGDLYRAHVRDRADRLKAWLREVQA